MFLPVEQSHRVAKVSSLHFYAPHIFNKLALTLKRLCSIRKRHAIALCASLVLTNVGFTRSYIYSEASLSYVVGYHCPGTCRHHYICTCMNQNQVYFHLISPASQSNQRRLTEFSWPRWYRGQRRHPDWGSYTIEKRVVLSHNRIRTRIY